MYLIVGEGPEGKRLRRLVRQLGLEDKVIFVGPIPYGEVAKYYKLCDVYVMPSKEVRTKHHWFEGFGIVYLEANACGKPVIGGRSGGVGDAVIHGQTGLLVNPYDVKEMSKALQLLLTDRRYASLLGQQGKQRVESDFTWGQVIGKIRAIIQQEK
jgi:phosphatidylinositol alpha-1,6-mannosyltransferase